MFAVLTSQGASASGGARTFVTASRMTLGYGLGATSNQYDGVGRNTFQVSNAGEIASPALIIYTERAKENIRRMVAIAGGPNRLRPHVKAHKCTELARA